MNIRKRGAASFKTNRRIVTEPDLTDNIQIQKGLNI